MSVETVDLRVTLNNPADQEKLRKIISECSDSMTRIAAERDLIKETVNAISEELDIPKKLIKKMVNVYYKQQFDQQVAEQDAFEQLYETVIK